MLTALRSSDRSPRPRKRIALACLPALAAAMPALVAGVAGAGVTHTWDGSANTSWQTAANWNTNLVPAAGDSAIILGGPANVFLNADSQNLATLFVGGGRSLSNNGFNLSVLSGASTTTVNGPSSTLFITDSSDPHGFDTGTLTVESNGRLQMADGWAMVAEQLTLSSGGRILGNGYVYVSENAPAAFNAANGSDITVSGGDLTLGVTGGGSIALAPMIDITSPNRTLYIDAPIFLPVNDINLGDNSAFSSEHNWILDGTLAANPGSGNTSRIEGDGDVTVGGLVSVFNNGKLSISPQIDFESGSTTTMGLGSTLELDGPYRAFAGHVTTIGPNATLQLDGLPNINGWDGDIVSNGGIIESNNAISFRIDGDLTLGSFAALRTAINGSSPVRASGPVDVPGLGATVNGAFDLSATGVMSLDMATTSIAVNGELILRTDSTTFGDGSIQVNAGGQLIIERDANVGVDVTNSGDLYAGAFNNAHDVDLNGAFTQTATGRLMFNIAGDAPDQQDFFDVHDDATLAGTLHITLANGFTPAEGQQFEVLAANIVTGSFSALTGSPGFSVSYTPDSVVLTYEGVGGGLYADVNDDGFVNVDDLIAVILAWGACPPAPGGAACPADITLDGQVNVDDLIAVILNWT